MKKGQMLFIIFFSLFCSCLYMSQSKVTIGISCLNFKIKNDYGVFFGNNEDHALTQISNTVITFVPNGSTWYDGSTILYGAVIVGYGNVSGLSWFQGGMNEKGLAFDSTSVPYTTPNLHSERPQNLVPEIFSCKTITEVIDYKAAHGVYQQEGSVQSMYLDNTGESVVFNIGVDGEFDFFRNNDTFQLASNFYFNNTSRGNPSSDSIRRYNAAEEKLNDIDVNSTLTIESIRNVLEAAHFEGPLINTLYSNIFDVTNGDIYLYFFHQFEEVVILNLEQELAKGWHSYRISDLFTQELVDKALNEYHEYSILIRLFPTDILLLIVTILLDIIISIYIIFLLIRRLIHKIGKSKQLNKLKTNTDTSKGLRTQIILSLAIIWSFLSFSMIYWNHSGEWWPFFDDIPILNLSLQPFYAFHNLFLLFSILGIFLTAFLLFSFSNKGELVILVKRGLTLGKKEKSRYIVNFSIPVLIAIIFLFLEIFNIIPKLDWLMFVITYPLIVIMLIILLPLAKKKEKEDQNSTQVKLIINLIKESAFLILTWAIWFLPLLFTGILDQMYILLLLNLSISLTVVAFFEIFLNHREYREKRRKKLNIN
ncbi:MAG: hypothetical protein ACFE88_12690 [Candidatus Hermodarchaeota archaeon]